MATASRSATEAILLAEMNAHRRFLSVAYFVGVGLARDHKEIDSVMIRDRMYLDFSEVNTHDDRALGAIMRRLARAGAIERTNRTRKSGKTTNHNRDIRIWRSLIFGNQGSLDLRVRSEER